jgi:hypothetical protein
MRRQFVFEVKQHIERRAPVAVQLSVAPEMFRTSVPVRQNTLASHKAIKAEDFKAFGLIG